MTELSELARERALRLTRLLGSALFERRFDDAQDLSVVLKSVVMGYNPPKSPLED